MNQTDFIQNTLQTIETFAERYLPHAENSNVTNISTEENEKIRFTINNDYHLFAWLEKKGELHIETEYGDDVFVSCKEDWWTDSLIQFMRFGTQIL